MAQHQLGGQIGTDPNFSHATHTGHSRADAQHTDPQPELELTPEEQEIFDGKKGDVLQKAIKTVVDYGRLFGADRLVDLGGAPHMAVSWGSDGVEPLLKIYTQLHEAGLKTYKPFTADPKPMDPENLPVTDEEQAAVDKIYDRMDQLEDLRDGHVHRF
jgi:predicted aconitase